MTARTYRVRRLRGTADPRAQVKFRRRVQMLRGLDIDQAIVRLNWWLQSEYVSITLARLNTRQPPYRVQVLHDLHLILRFMRRYQTPQEHEFTREMFLNVEQQEAV